MVMKKRTDEELKQIAKDLYAGKIFTDRHLKQHEMSMLNFVFMPLAFLNEKEKEEFRATAKAGQFGLIYEYIDKALPRSINGLPMFTSMRLLSKDDTEKVNEYYESVVKVMEDI